jgi:predicted transposase/invertase (TIGR01784 family)
MNYYTDLESDLFWVNESIEPPYEGVYIDILTDFGFKHIFGKESHKDILIAFLNVLFQGTKVIKDLSYNNTENKGYSDSYRSVHFDLVCTDTNGEQFILEMQRSKQAFFMERCLFYNARLLVDQAPNKGINWKYDLKGVFTVSILEENLNELNTGTHFITPVQLVNKNNNETFCHKTGYIFLELSKFDKKIEALETDLDRWCYVLKHLHRMKKLPQLLHQEVFTRIFKIAELAKLPKEEKFMYDQNLKAKRAYYNALDYAKQEAIREGRAEGRAEGKLALENKTNDIAIKLIRKGLDVSSIAEITGLSLDHLNKLIKNLD